MNVNFKKYQGTGNDFIMIDNRSLFFKRENQELVEKLCHRRFGIGADGLILLQNKHGYDFEMVYFNSDGRESSMCGNGGRCIIQFAKEIGVIQNQCKFWAIDGEHFGSIDVQGVVTIKMNDVSVVEQNENTFVLNTGSPHFVQFKNNIKQIDVLNEARNIRYGERFAKEGINVNFVETIGKNAIKIRTYERGVEDETLSCGTGVVAASISNYLFTGTNQNKIEVQAEGGKLQVEFEYDGKVFSNIKLIGAAEKVFEGCVSI
jgi:diaminopimelate epimerase